VFGAPSVQAAAHFGGVAVIEQPCDRPTDYSDAAQLLAVGDADDTHAPRHGPVGAVVFGYVGVGYLSA
jgi:hypothetical protein